MALKVGAEFAGYGGAELGLGQVLEVEPAWFVEFDHAPSRILAHHWAGVTNYGDITTVDWDSVTPVDIITGGSPCQDLSQAGARKGMTDGTRSNLWVSMRESIATLRPHLVVWENVRGAYSACADSALGRCPRCMGVDPTGGHAPQLRALGRVLGDLSDLGYDAWWYGIPASACGAAHERFRVFVFAVPADSTFDAWRLLHGNLRPARHSAGVGGEGVRPEGVEVATSSSGPSLPGRAGVGTGLTLLPTPTVNNHKESGHCRDFGGDLTHAVSCGCVTERTTACSDGYEDDSAAPSWTLTSLAGEVAPASTADGSSSARLLPTPSATDGTKGGPNQRGSKGDLMLPSAVALLPTPAVNDMGAGKTVEDWDAWTDRMKDRHGNGNGHGKSLSIEAQRLLPTPSVADTQGGRKHRSGSRSGELLLNGIAAHQQWGQYAAAIARAEHAFGRPAPTPTEPGPNGNPRLSAAFVEWHMGLPAGHVTNPDIWHGMTDKKGNPASASAIRSAQLKALGNGIVPQQIAAAFRLFWEDFTAHMTEAVAS